MTPERGLTMTAFERFRAQWLQSHPPEDDSCDCMSYSRALWDAATEAARSWIKKCPRFARTPKRCCYTCDDRACRGRSPCRVCVVAQWERPLMRECWSKA